MKTLFCSKCQKTKPSGKFCPDCGAVLEEKVTLGAKFSKVKTSKYVPGLTQEIYKWLSRIGVKKEDVKVIVEHKAARIEYVLLGEKYNFDSSRQDTATENLAAIAIFLHHRVIGIERGIETAQQAFHGYTALPSPGQFVSSPYDRMSKPELKKLLQLYHPDHRNAEADVDKFNEVKAALDRKKE